MGVLCQLAVWMWKKCVGAARRTAWLLPGQRSVYALVQDFIPVLAHTYFFEAMPSAASAAPILFGTGTWRVASHPEAQRKSPAFADDFRRAGDCGREIEALCAYFIEEVPQYEC